MVLREKRRGSLRAGNEHGSQQGQQKQRKQQLAHPRLRRNRRNCRAGHANTDAARKKNQGQRGQDLANRYVIQHGKDRQEQQFGKQKEQRIGTDFREKDGEGIADRKPQGAQRIVDLLPEKARLKHKRGSKQKRQPEQPRPEAPRLGRRWVKREAEEHHHHQDEHDRGSDQFAGANIRAQLLYEQHSR